MYLQINKYLFINIYRTLYAYKYIYIYHVWRPKRESNLTQIMTLSRYQMANGVLTRVRLLSPFLQHERSKKQL